jgi:hypothetical protein
VQAAVNDLEPTPNGMRATYDENIDKMVVVWRQNLAPSYTYMQGVTITGTTPSAGANTVINTANSQFQDIEYNSTLQLNYCVLFNSALSTIPSLLIAPSATNVTSTNFLGISDASISSAASGNITIKGGIASTGLSSLTPGSDYYVQDDGTLSTSSTNTKAGKALSATTINLEYTS